MSDDVPEGQIKPEDVLSQFMVVRTKDNQIAVQFPTKNPLLHGIAASKDIDATEALELIAAGLNIVAQIMRQQEQTPPEKPRIVLAPAIPKEFLTKGMKAE